MRSKLLVLFFALLIIALISCKNSADKAPAGKAIDPFQSALPHGKTLPESNLSVVDQQKLTHAIGREVASIHIDDLTRMIDSSKNTLHAYVFWNLNCQQCLSQHKLLQKLQNESGGQNLKLVFISLDPLSDTLKVNASIREQSISQDVYIVSDLTFSELAPKYHNIFKSSPPGILFVNKKYETFVFYKQVFEYDELYALIQPLLM